MKITVTTVAGVTRDFREDGTLATITYGIVVTEGNDLKQLLQNARVMTSTLVGREDNYHDPLNAYEGSANIDSLPVNYIDAIERDIIEKYMEIKPG